MPLAFGFDTIQYDDLISALKQPLTDTASLITEKRRFWSMAQEGRLIRL